MSGILCTMVGASFTVAAAAEVIRKKTSILSAGSTVSTTQSKFGGSSATFNGSSQYINVPHQTQLDISAYSNWTIECWSRLTDGTSRTILNKDGITGSVYPGYTFYTNGSKQVTFGVGGSAGNWITVTRSTALADNTWYHLAAVKNGATVTFYVDGVSAGTATFVGYTDQSRPLYIGWEADGTYMYGYIDEIRISNSARYTTTFTPSTTPFVNDANTVFLMHANGTDGSTFFEDDNGVRNQVGLYSTGGALISTTQSKFGGSSMFFDGTNDLVRSGVYNSLALNTGNWTIEGWIYTSDDLCELINYQDYPTNNGWAFGLRSSGRLLFVSGDGGSSLNVILSSNGAYTNNTWTHFAVVYNSGTITLYSNGTNVGSSAWVSPDFASVDGLRIGAGYGNSSGLFQDGLYYYVGYLDEVRVSNTARYTANFTVATTPFVNDANTVLLLHGDGTNSSTVFRDDNGAVANRQPKSITAVGNAQVDTAQSQFGGASALFDGSGDYLTVSPGADLTDLTVELWYRATSLPGSGLVPLISFNNTLMYIGYSGANTVYDYYANGSGRVSLNTVAISTGVWYHVAFVRSGSSITIYHNGTSVTTGTFATAVDWATYGAEIAKYSSYFLNGHMDEIRVSNTARYTTTFTPSTTPFVNDANTLLLIHANGTDASTVFEDDTANRTQIGITANSSAQISTAQSKFGGSSALFARSGANDWIKTADSSRLSVENYATWTVEFWLRFANAQSDNFPISTSDDKFNMRIQSGGSCNWNMGPGGSNPSWTQTHTVGTWYHYALVKESDGTHRVYLNGTSVATGTLGGTTPTSRSWYFGDRFDTGYCMDGYMDEIRISSTARYTTTFTPSTTPFQNDANTLLLLHCDGSNASTAFFDDNGIAPYTP